MARSIFLTSVLLILISCTDIFSTREPEEPDGGGGGYFYDTVSGLVTGFKTSLYNLDLYRYESLFFNEPDVTDQKYRFISNADDITAPEIFEDWTVENEKKFISGLKNSGYEFVNIDVGYEPVDETALYLELIMSYSIEVSDQDNSYILSGNFVLDIVKVNSFFWYIRTWTDISPAGNISFSSIKAPYAF